MKETTMVGEEKPGKANTKPMRLRMRNRAGTVVGEIQNNTQLSITDND